jgi:hypothetical protein
MRRDALTAEFAGVREQDVAVARAAVGENARTKLQRDPLTQANDCRGMPLPAGCSWYLAPVQFGSCLPSR